jgi:hypothetical protein
MPRVMSTSKLEELRAGQPDDVRAEIIRINTDARPRALQVALLVPLLAGLIGLFNSFRMVSSPEPKPSGSAEATVLVDSRGVRPSLPSNHESPVSTG